MTARTTKVSANPVLQTRRPGRTAAPSGKSAATMSDHPIVWWRNAARENSHVFCSWTRKVTPEKKRAAAVTSHQRELESFPRTTASCTAPAIMADSAHTEWATRCIVEKVEKMATTQRKIPPTSATNGHR